MENTEILEEKIEFVKYDEESNLVTASPEDIAQIVVSTLVNVAGIKPSDRFIKAAVVQHGLFNYGLTEYDVAISEMEYIVREALRSRGPFKDFDDYNLQS